MLHPIAPHGGASGSSFGSLGSISTIVAAGSQCANRPYALLNSPFPEKSGTEAGDWLEMSFVLRASAQSEEADSGPVCGHLARRRFQPGVAWLPCHTEHPERFSSARHLTYKVTPIADDDRRQAVEWLDDMGFLMSNQSSIEHASERELLANLDRRLHLAYSKRCAAGTCLPDEAA